MGSEWKKLRLGDVISVSGGFSYKGKHIGAGNTFLLGMGCVSFIDTFLDGGARRYAGDTPERHLIKPGEIVLATRQQSENLPILGVPAMVPQRFRNERVIVGTNLYKVHNSSEISNQFLFWLLKSPDYHNHIKLCSKGTTVKMITKDAVESFTFLCPPKANRDSIASFLWGLTDKIALLRKMNETLEQMAQALFQSWFVEDKRECLREMHLGNLVDIDTGFAFKSKFYQEEGELKVIRGKNVTLGTIRWGSDAKYWSESTEGLEKYFLNRLDIVIGMDGSRVGQNRSLVLKSDLPSILAQRVARVRAKNPALQPLIWRLINSKAFEQYVELIKTGTSIPHISQSQIASFEIRVPSLEEMVRFSHSASSFIDKQEANLEQIQTLTSLRDTLLPKLISGELEVGEVIYSQ